MGLHYVARVLRELEVWGNGTVREPVASGFQPSNRQDWIVALNLRWFIDNELMSLRAHARLLSPALFVVAIGSGLVMFILWALPGQQGSSSFRQSPAFTVVCIVFYAIIVAINFGVQIYGVARARATPEFLAVNLADRTIKTKNGLSQYYSPTKVELVGGWMRDDRGGSHRIHEHVYQIFLCHDDGEMKHRTLVAVVPLAPWIVRPISRQMAQALGVKHENHSIPFHKCPNRSFFERGVVDNPADDR